MTGERVIYRDGELLAADRTAPDAYHGTGALWLGAGEQGTNHHFKGQLDDLKIYQRSLTADQVRALTVAGWQPTTLSAQGSGVTEASWQTTPPLGLEGNYALHLRSTDSVGNQQILSAAWIGQLDTLAPRAVLTRQIAPTQTTYELIASDLNLDADALSFAPCELHEGTSERYVLPWLLAAAGRGYVLPFRTTFRCTVEGTQSGAVRATVRDRLGNETTASLGEGAAMPAMHAEQARLLAPISPAALVIAQPAAVEVGAANVMTPLATAESSTTPPLLLIDDAPGELTLSPSGRLAIRGIISTTQTLADLRLALDGPVQRRGIPAIVRGRLWFADVQLGANVPTAQPYTLTAVVTTTTGITATTSLSVTLDPHGPQIGTPAITFDGAPANIGQTYRTPALQATVAFTVTDEQELVELQYGWVDQFFNGSLTTLQPGTAHLVIDFTATLTTSVAGDGRVYYHYIYAKDANGKVSKQLTGPFFQDLLTLPDYTSASDLERPDASRPYRGWMQTDCTLVGHDQRLSERTAGNAPSQALYATRETWLGDTLRLTWAGADWAHDGDLFIYFDTIPNQEAGPDGTPAWVGSNVAYNPYPATRDQTIVHLPGRDLSNANPGGYPYAFFHADYALWVRDRATAILLRWNEAGGQWVEQATLPDRDLASYGYRFNGAADNLTDLWLPMELMEAEGIRTIGLVAFAVEEGALRTWAAIPARNPVDSARVNRMAPALGEPHRLRMSTAYTLDLNDGACNHSLNRLDLHILSSEGALVTSSEDDEIQLLAPGSQALLTAWDQVTEQATTDFRRWLNETYCVNNRDALACQPEAPRSLDAIASIMARYGATNFRPIQPGAVFTYTVRYQNNTATPSGPLVARFGFDESATVAPVGGCLFLDLPGLAPGAFGEASISFRLERGTLGQVRVEAWPGSLEGSCGFAPEASTSAVVTLINHTPDNEAPVVALEAPIRLVPAADATIMGIVRDASPVNQYELAIDGPGGGLITCTDPDDDDGHWQCPWQAGASNPADGTVYRVRARATDAFGQVGPWSPWGTAVIDRTAPTLTVRDDLAPALGATAPITGVLLGGRQAILSGRVHDNRLSAGVEVCTAGVCDAATITVDGTSVASGSSVVADLPATPVVIPDATEPGVCAPGNTITRDVVVTDAFTIMDVEVGLQLAHTYRGDLLITLRSPQGTTVRLVGEASAEISAEHYNVRLSDRATMLAANDQGDHPLDGPAFVNQRAPEEALAALIGEPAQGTWVLSICDTYPDDTGAYRQGELRFTTDRLPTDGSAQWNYRLAETAAYDNVNVVSTIYARDKVGNRTLGATLSYWVDSVAPVLEARAITDTIGLANRAPTLLGTVSDGSPVDLFLIVTTPDGQITQEEVAQQEDGRWHYALEAWQSGTHTLQPMAIDAAGNSTLGEAWRITVGDAAIFRQYLPITRR